MCLKWNLNRIYAFLVFWREKSVLCNNNKLKCFFDRDRCFKVSLRLGLWPNMKSIDRSDNENTVGMNEFKVVTLILFNTFQLIIRNLREICVKVKISYFWNDWIFHHRIVMRKKFCYHLFFLFIHWNPLERIVVTHLELHSEKNRSLM